MWAGSVNTCCRSVGSICVAAAYLHGIEDCGDEWHLADGQKKMRAVHEAVLVWQSRTVDERRIRSDTSCH